MITALLGIGFGAGVLLTWLGLRPRPEPLAAALARLDHPAPARSGPAARSSDAGSGAGKADAWDTRLGAAALRHVGPLRRATERTRRDLRTAGRSAEEQSARTLLFAAFGFFLGPWLGVVTWLAGNTSPPVLPGTVALVGATVGAASPWASVRNDAKRRRRDFSLALAVWCDLVSRCLASGRGVDESVATAARAGSGWAFSELRAALSGGAVRGETPWASLDRLGAELGIEDLRELSATIGMAGEEGAAVREAVATKARTIRERVTSDTERAAEAATAQMPMPTFVVALGFLVFLGYPALAALARSGF